MKKIEVLVIRELNKEGMAICLKPLVSFVITPSIVHELRNVQNQIAEDYYKNTWEKVHYAIWYLHSGKISWKGLDYYFIYNCLKRSKETILEQYISELFDLLFINYIGLGIPLINCSIIKRYLQGISQDFFYLNRVNFIQDLADNFDHECGDRQDFININLKNILKKSYFPHEIYERNKFLSFSHTNMKMMKKIVSSLKFEPLNLNDIQECLAIFENIRDKVIKRIYQRASRNIKIIKRAAQIQSSEHQYYVQNIHQTKDS